MTDKTLYNGDSILWVQENSRALENGDLSKEDIQNLLIQIRKLVNPEARELKKLLTRLIAILLLWSDDSIYRNSSWADKIIELRGDINHILNFSPSFKKELPNFCKEVYQDAILIAGTFCKDVYQDDLLIAGSSPDLNKSYFPATLQMSVFDILNGDVYDKS
jgi:hypothetical protein